MKTVVFVTGVSWLCRTLTNGVEYGLDFLGGVYLRSIAMRFWRYRKIRDRSSRT
ncbi:hypothetical protein BDV19DRAFT_361017 [Aspergillus venezuelensis]